MTSPDRKSVIISLKRPWGTSWFEGDFLPNEITCECEKISVLSFDYYESEVLLSSQGEKWIGIVHFFSKEEEPKFLNWTEPLDSDLVSILGINQVKVQDPLGKNCSNEDKGGAGYFSAIWEGATLGHSIRTLTDRILWYGKLDHENNILSVEALGLEDVASLIGETGSHLEMPGGLLNIKRQANHIVLDELK